METVEAMIARIRATLDSNKGVMIPMLGNVMVSVVPSACIENAGEDWYLVSMVGHGAYAWQKGTLLSPFKLIGAGFPSHYATNVAFIINKLFGVTLIDDTSGRQSPDGPLLEYKEG